MSWHPVSWWYIINNDIQWYIYVDILYIIHFIYNIWWIYTCIYISFWSVYIYMVAVLSRDHPFICPWHYLMSTKVTTSQYRNAQKHCKIQYEITLLLNFKKKYSLKEREHICNKWRPKFGKKSLNVYCKTLLILPNPKKQKRTRENLKNLKNQDSDTLVWPPPSPGSFQIPKSKNTPRRPKKPEKPIFQRSWGWGFSRGFFEVCPHPHPQVWGIQLQFKSKELSF